MSRDVVEFRRYFTPDEANRALPLVRAIAQDLASLSQEVIERRQRLASLRSHRQGQQSSIYADEVSQIEEQLERDTAQIYEYVEELRALGVEPKNGPEGLVDFPAMRDGRVVFLCWKLGESEVEFWHELDAGFVGRQPLTALTAGGDDAEQAEEV